jgi:hypothetical protein
MNVQNKTAHTPGPWIVGIHDTFGFDVLVRADKETSEPEICQMIAIGDDAETVANARLISAAPDMLAVCKNTSLDYAHDKLSELLEDYDASSDAIRSAAIDLCGELCNHYEARQNAIRKAEGN